MVFYPVISIKRLKLVIFKLIYEFMVHPKFIMVFKEFKLIVKYFLVDPL